MGKQKLDGVVEAAHFAANGELAWVRIYERRGPTFSDLVLLSRIELLARLRAGKTIYVGQRRQYEASSFDLARPLVLARQGDREFITTSAEQPGKDLLEDVPVV